MLFFSRLVNRSSSILAFKSGIILFHIMRNLCDKYWKTNALYQQQGEKKNAKSYLSYPIL